MSKMLKDRLIAFRPPAPPGRGDKYLADHAQEVRRIVTRGMKSDTKDWPPLGDLLMAHVSLGLVEMAEDLHNDLGIWRALEQHNLELHQTPLPFLLAPGEPGPNGFDARRFQYYIYVTLRHVINLIHLKPRDEVLRVLAVDLSRYFNDKFARMPADSGVKNFFAQPHDDLLGIKRKMLWFGQSSYLHRMAFSIFSMAFQEQDQRNYILSQYCTRVATVWTGLTPIEMLARVLTLPESEQQAVQQWRQPLICFGPILAVQPRDSNWQAATIRNLFNGQEYTGLAMTKWANVRVGLLIHATLNPWQGQWYWDDLRPHASQRQFTPAELAAVRLSEMTTLGSAVFELFPALKEQAPGRLAQFHEQFVTRHGGDLTVVRTGREAIVLWQELHQSLDPGGVMPGEAEAARLFPKEFLDCQDGMAIFSDPQRGLSFALHFDVLQPALQKNAADLTTDDMRVLGALVFDLKTSPAMVRRLAAEYGPAALAARFNLGDEPPDLALDWLLRAYKGLYYDPAYFPHLCLRPPPPIESPQS